MAFKEVINYIMADPPIYSAAPMPPVPPLGPMPPVPPMAPVPPMGPMPPPSASSMYSYPPRPPMDPYSGSPTNIMKPPLPENNIISKSHSDSEILEKQKIIGEIIAKCNYFIIFNSECKIYWDCERIDEEN